MATIEVRGLNDFINFSVKLPRKTHEEVTKVMEKFARKVQKSAKLNVSRKGKGDLRDSIKVRPGNNRIMITVDSPYGAAQEHGFTPHWVHTDMPSRVRGTIGSRLRTNKRGFIFVRRHKPFIAPALETNLNKLPAMLKQAMEKATAKSK